MKLISIVLILIFSVIVISGAVEEISTEGQGNADLTPAPKIIKVQPTEEQEKAAENSGLSLQPVPETIASTAESPQIIAKNEEPGVQIGVPTGAKTGIQTNEGAGNSEKAVITKIPEKNPEQDLQGNPELKDTILGLQNNLENLKKSNSESSTEGNNAANNALNGQEALEDQKVQTEPGTASIGQQTGTGNAPTVINSADAGANRQASLQEGKTSIEPYSQETADKPADGQENTVDKQSEEQGKNVIIVRDEENSKSSESSLKEEKNLIPQDSSQESSKPLAELEKQQDTGSSITQEGTGQARNRPVSPETGQQDKMDETLSANHEEGPGNPGNPGKQEEVEKLQSEKEKVKVKPEESSQNSQGTSKEDTENDIEKGPELKNNIENSIENSGDSQKVVNSPENNKNTENTENDQGAAGQEQSTDGQPGPVTEEKEPEISNGQQTTQPVKYFPEQGQATDTYFNGQKPAGEEKKQGEQNDGGISEVAEEELSPAQGTNNAGDENKEDLDSETGPKLDIIKEDEGLNSRINEKESGRGVKKEIEITEDSAALKKTIEKTEITGEACPAAKSQKCEVENPEVKMKPCKVAYSPENRGMESEPKTVTFNWTCPKKSDNETQNSECELNPEKNTSEENYSGQNESEENKTEKNSWQNIKFILSHTYSSDSFYTTHENVKVEYDGPEALAGQKVDVYLVKKNGPDFSEGGIFGLENDNGGNDSARFEELVRKNTESYVQIPAVLDEKGDLLPLTFDPLPAGDYWTVIILAGEEEINPSESGSASISSPEPGNQKQILSANYFKVLEYEMRAEVPGTVKEGEDFGVNLSLEGQVDEETGNYIYWAVLINEDSYKANLNGDSNGIEAGIENFLSGINFLVNSGSGSSDPGTNFQNAFSSGPEASKAKFTLEVQKLIGEGKGAVTIGEENQKTLSLTSADLIPGDYFLFAGAYEKDNGLAGIVQKKLTIYVPKVVYLDGKASASPENGPGSSSIKKKLPSILESKDSIFDSLESVSLGELSPRIGDATVAAKIFIKNPPKIPSLILGFMITFLSGLAIMKIRRQP